MSSHVSEPSDLELASTSDQIDPDLLELPDPPRKERRSTMALLLLTALASIAMVAALSRDAVYAFASPMPLELADLRIAPPNAFVPNSYVQGEAMLAAAGAIRYEHPFESDSYRLAPVAGRSDVWVEVRISSGEENSRYVPTTKFKGRLIPFDSAGLRHRGLANSVASLTGQGVPAHSWLLVDGQTPGDARGIVLLLVLFLGFAIWNARTIVKLARRVK